MLSVKAPLNPFQKTLSHLGNISKKDYINILKSFGQEGIDALASATPVKSGITASSWTFKLAPTRGGYILCWNNTNENDGAPIAVMLQYGHGTGSGGWVEGRDYINPAIQPIFDRMSAEIGKQVKSA